MELKNETQTLDGFRDNIQSLVALEDGWLDGEGKAPSPEDLVWLADLFESYFSNSVNYPFLYPTLESNNGVQAEWFLGVKDISLEIDLDDREAQLDIFDLSTSDNDNIRLNLNHHKDWQILIDTIDNLVEGA